jgi:hypothetical protein
MMEAAWLKEPFGPYLEQTLFEPKVNMKVPLQGLLLFRGEQHIGLDDTEVITCLPEGADDRPVVCFGTLELEDKSGLHPDGIRVLDKAINKRYYDKLTNPRGTCSHHRVGLRNTCSTHLKVGKR